MKNVQRLILCSAELFETTKKECAHKMGEGTEKAAWKEATSGWKEWWGTVEDKLDHADRCFLCRTICRDLGGRPVYAALSLIRDLTDKVDVLLNTQQKEKNTGLVRLLNMLSQLAPPVGPKDELVLLVPEEVSAAIKARWASEALRKATGATVRCRVVGEWKSGAAETKTTEGRRTLLRVACEELAQHQETVVLLSNSTTCDSGLCLALAAWLNGSVLFVTLDNDRLARLPQTRLTPDIRVWNRYFVLFERLSATTPGGVNLATFCRWVAELIPDLNSEKSSHEKTVSAFQTSAESDKHTDWALWNSAARKGVRVDAPEPLAAFVETSSYAQVRLSPLGELLCQLAKDVHADPLTQLFRRSFFDQALAPWLEQQRFTSCGVILCDLDHFKQVNDRFGHDAGDQVLRTVGDRIRVLLTEPWQQWALRWGGEEFLIVTINKHLQELRLLAERIRQSIATKPFKTPSGEQLWVTLTAGVACWEQTTMATEIIAEGPNSGHSVFQFHRLLKLADEALYCGKRKGRNCVCNGD